MSLATLNPNGYPDARMVLLKDFDERGFTFYTNLNSVKGRSLKKAARAALVFYWEPLARQVRIQGKTEIVSGKEADAYWKSRPRLSQLGAWASQQSDVLPHRDVLLKEVARLARHYGAGPIPRPPYWTGVRVIPHHIEFWQGRANRLHDRLLYTKAKNRWRIDRLYP